MSKPVRHADSFETGLRASSGSLRKPSGPPPLSARARPNRFYMATCVPGAEMILRDEIEELLNKSGTEAFPGGRDLRAGRGKVFFFAAAEAERLSELRCADNVYRVIKKFEIGGHREDLGAYKAVIRAIFKKPEEFSELTRGRAAGKDADSQRPPLRSGLAGVYFGSGSAGDECPDSGNAVGGRPDFRSLGGGCPDSGSLWDGRPDSWSADGERPASGSAALTAAAGPLSFVVSASRAGKHTYSRFDLSDAAADALVSTGLFIPGDNMNHDVAFRVDVKDGGCVFSVQLTPPGFRFRGEFACVPGGIRPTVAHCLVRVSRPANTDVFYDPFCGAGTIAAERAFYGHRKILASDISAWAVETAKANLGGGAAVFRADAVSTGMKAASVDAVVSNLPWGKQAAVEDLDRLYRDFLLELKRILKNNGRAVILTDRRDALMRACAKAGFEAGAAAELSLHGLRPGVFLLREKGLMTEDTGS